MYQYHEAAVQADLVKYSTWKLKILLQVLSPGLRLGWATAAPALLEKLIFHLHGSTLGPCALSQVVVASLLHHWGPQGFEQHVKDMQQGYARRAHILHAAAGEADLSDCKVLTLKSWRVTLLVISCMHISGHTPDEVALLFVAATTVACSSCGFCAWFGQARVM